MDGPLVVLVALVGVGVLYLALNNQGPSLSPNVVPPSGACDKGGTSGQVVGVAGSAYTRGVASPNAVCGGFLAIGGGIVQPITKDITNVLANIPVIGGLVSSTGNRSDASAAWQNRLGAPPPGTTSTTTRPTPPPITNAPGANANNPLGVHFFV